MARVVLLPCKLREDRFVPIKGAEAVEFDGPALCAELTTVPATNLSPQQRYKRSAEISKLRQLQRGAYVGIMRGRSGRTTNFYLKLTNPASNRIDWLLRKDPLLGRRIETVYRVLEVDWEQSGLEEFV